MGFRNNLTGKSFGKLTVIGFDYSKNMWECTCSCGGHRFAKTKELTRGDVKSCGCLHRQKLSKDITGNRYGKLVAVRLDHRDEDGRAYWECRCDCGESVVVGIKILTVGNKTSCGHCIDKEMIGSRFGKLTVLSKDYIKNRKQYWKCKCDCGNIVSVPTGSLRSGNTKSCGCSHYNYEDLLGNKFNMLTPIKYVGASKWLCKCDCGNETVVASSDLKNNHICSCGCNNIAKSGSLCENEIRDFVYNYIDSSLVVLHDREVLDGHEIDIYIPSLSLGIEYNGSPYHASENGLYKNVGKYYHRDKFMLAKSKGVHLVSVFDLDYETNKVGVLSILHNLLSGEEDNIVPNSATIYTNNDYDCGSWLYRYNYVPIGQVEPEFFIYQGKYKVYRCGKTIWKRQGGV